MPSPLRPTVIESSSSVHDGVTDAVYIVGVMHSSSPQIGRRFPFPRDRADHVDPRLQSLVDSVLAAGVLLALALVVYVLIFGNP